MYVSQKFVPNSTSDVMEWIMYDHFPGLVYLSNHDVIDMSQFITDNFTTKLRVLLVLQKSMLHHSCKGLLHASKCTV